MKIDMHKLANLPPNSPNCKQPAYEQGEPAEVLPYLYLGSAFHAQQDHFLEKYGITAVVNCQKQEVKQMSSKVQIVNIPIDDNAIADIKSHFFKVIDFIDREHAKGGKTLVHCRAGISRSATICLAYLIKTRGYGWEQAYNFVKQRRSLINPNFNFMGQLQKFESECKERENKSKIDPDDSMQISPENSPKRVSPMSVSPMRKSPAAVCPPTAGIRTFCPLTANPNNFKKPFEIPSASQENFPSSTKDKNVSTPVSFFTFGSSASSTTSSHSKSKSNRSPRTCGNQSPSPVQTPSPTAIVQ
jgi:protein-tyrosine phosphatase